MSNARDLADQGHQLVAWVSFIGGQVTDPASKTGVNGSFGVDSILDEGTGAYRVNFAVDMPDINYCVVMGQNATNYTTGGLTHQYFSESHNHYAAGYFQVKCITSNGTAADTQTVNAAVFR